MGWIKDKGGRDVKRSILVFVVGIAIMLTAGAICQAKTLGELLPNMLEQHERLKAAQDTEAAGMQRFEAAKRAWYPKLNITGDVAREVTDYNTAASVTLTHNIEKFRATQNIWDGGLTDGTIRTSGGAYKQAEYSRTFTRQGLLLEGSVAYLQLMKAVRTLDYAMQSEQNIKRQTGIEESLVEKGAGLSSDVLQAKAQLAQAAALRVVNEGQLENARSRFKAVFGFAPDDPLVATFTYPDAPYDRIPGTLDEAINIALQENPSLLVSRSMVEAADGSVETALASFYPHFNAFAEYWRKENDGGQKDLVKWEQRLGVEFSYNLYNGGGDSATLAASRKDRSAAVNTVLDVERTIEEQVRVSWQNLITARAKAEWFRNQAVISEEFLELARKERKLGNRSLLDVLSAEVNLNSARSGAVSAEVDQMIQAYSLLHAMGHLELDLYSAM